MLRLRPAFSLLELIIVLMVMIGLMAIVWPNLQRPLSRTSLDEGAQTVRNTLDESRYQATLAGTPWFIKLDIGSSSLSAGPFAAFLEDNRDAFSNNVSFTDGPTDSDSSPTRRMCGCQNA